MFLWDYTNNNHLTNALTSSFTSTSLSDNRCFETHIVTNYPSSNKFRITGLINNNLSIHIGLRGAIGGTLSILQLQKQVFSIVQPPKWQLYSLRKAFSILQQHEFKEVLYN